MSGASAGVKLESVGRLGASDGHFWPLVEDTIQAAGISPELDEQRVEECLARLTEVWSERTATWRSFLLPLPTRCGHSVFCRQALRRTILEAADVSR